MSNITDGAKFNNSSSYYLAKDPTGGGGDVIQGNLLVNGNLSVSGNTTTTGQETAGSLNVVGASSLGSGGVAATTVGAGGLNVVGAITGSTTINVAGSGVIGTPSTSTSLTVNGNIVQSNVAAANTYNGQSNAFSGSVTVGGGAGPNAGVITASAFTNASTPNAVVQVITAGAFTGGSTSAGGGLIELPLTTIFPQSVNYKSYVVYMSGSATDLYADFVGGTSGAGGAGTYLGQFQTATGAFSQFKNLKGQCQPSQLTSPASPGTLTMMPDSVLCVSSALNANTIYYTVVATNGATLGFNNASVNIWLHFRGIL